MATKYSQKFPIPQGFAEILHDFTREILRDQPEDIIEYSTLYFEALHQGKPFHYESKYNVKPDQPQGSHYLPHGKKEFDAQNPPQKVEKTEKSEKSERSVPKERPSEEISERSIHSRDTSHKDEKSLAREYIKDLNEEILEQAVVAEEKSSVGKQSSKVLEDVNLSQGPKETGGEEEPAGEEEAAGGEEEAAAGEEAGAEGEEEAAGEQEEQEEAAAEQEEAAGEEPQEAAGDEPEEAAAQQEEGAAEEGN